MSGRWRWFGALVLAMSAMGPLPLHAASAIPTVKVAIRNFAFSPKVLNVRVGTRVEWTNLDEEPHTVTSAGGQFRSSGALDTGDRYAVTFSKPGTYPYYCAIHPMMVGTVVVK